MIKQANFIRHISSVRSAVVAGVMLLIVFSAPVNAQQQTGRVAPQTRNPQTNLAEPLQQQTTGIQSTGSDQVLKQSQSIQIPAGQPARSSGPGEDFDQGWSPFWVLLGLLVIVIAGGAVVRYWLRRRIALSVVPEPQYTALKEEPPEPIVKKTMSPKKKKRPANRPAKKRKKK